MSNTNSSDFWQSFYQTGSTGWDLGGPTPILCRLAESGEFSPGKMIVPGAGRGYDARLFARHGFTVTAVDFASDAIRDMHLLAEKDAPIAIVKADWFRLPSFFEGTFDYVLEYVAFCAIDPTRREEYLDVVKWLLKPGGTLIGLMFPIGDHEGGPPFAVDPEEVITALQARGLRLVNRECPADSIKPRQGREELLVFSKGEAI
ncbi:MAG: methyltransferase domain-containing protein [Anaerolineae bacterium]|nr:methyltransferase domain-containing protein [Anaerolineae bacterium]